MKARKSRLEQLVEFKELQEADVPVAAAEGEDQEGHTIPHKGQRQTKPEQGERSNT